MVKSINIGDNIRKIRNEMKMTQDDLAKKLGYSNNTFVSNLEKKGNDISFEILFKIGEILNVPLGKLIYGDTYEDPKLKKFYPSSFSEQVTIRKHDNKLSNFYLIALILLMITFVLTIFFIPKLFIGILLFILSIFIIFGYLWIVINDIFIVRKKDKKNMNLYDESIIVYNNEDINVNNKVKKQNIMIFIKIILSLVIYMIMSDFSDLFIIEAKITENVFLFGFIISISFVYSYGSNVPSDKKIDIKNFKNPSNMIYLAFVIDIITLFFFSINLFDITEARDLIIGKSVILLSIFNILWYFYMFLFINKHIENYSPILIDKNNNVTKIHF